MALPGWRNWVFSARTSGGALLALWLAIYLNVDRPYWAMATACIVAQPGTGTMRSKAAYQFAGTVVTLATVPNLVNAPALLVATFCAGIGGCIGWRRMFPPGERYSGARQPGGDQGYRAVPY
jgi:uncharacterized membrane protein YccC